jgi:hypothetical protein
MFKNPESKTEKNIITKLLSKVEINVVIALFFQKYSLQ